MYYIRIRSYANHEIFRSHYDIEMHIVLCKKQAKVVK